MAIKGYELKDSSKLIRILDSEPKNINNLLDLLRVRSLKNMVTTEEEELPPISSSLPEANLDRLEEDQPSSTLFPKQEGSNGEENKTKTKTFVNITPQNNPPIDLVDDDDDDIDDEPESKTGINGVKSRGEQKTGRKQPPTQDKSTHPGRNIEKNPDDADKTLPVGNQDRKKHQHLEEFVPFLVM